MHIGAHVSTAGGFDRAIDRAVEIGAEAVQLFCSSPQGWAFKPLSDEAISAFRQKSKDNGIGPAFLHGIYLVNMGTPDAEHLKKGIDSLTKYMHVASAMGGKGVIFHGGSHKGVGFEGVFQQTVDAFKEVLTSSPKDVYLIIENSAGMGNHIGSSFAEIGRILKAVDSPQVKVCLDTQHAFAAGYELTTSEGVVRAMEEFDREIGVDNLAAVHANDSKTPFSSGVDRHENIGLGHMGEDAFVAIMAHPAFRDVPFLLEVPGAEGKGPDKPNVDLLKRLRARAGIQGNP